MNSDFLHNASLKTTSIEEVNSALIVLRHFIELNEKLLPMLLHLKLKKNKQAKDLADIEKIMCTFETFHFDVKSSQILMNSSILTYIKDAYKAIIEDSESLNTEVKLMLFVRELSKLRKNWQLVLQN